MKRLFATTAAVLALVALGACNDGDDDSNSNDQDDSTSAAVNEACKLFSEQDAEAVLGAPVEKETDVGGTEATSCSYVADDPTRVLGLGIGDFDTADDAEKAILRARADAQFDGLEVRQIDDVGNEAYYLPASNNFERTINDEQLTFGELEARDGTRVVTAFVTPENEDAARAIVELALG